MKTQFVLIIKTAKKEGSVGYIILNINYYLLSETGGILTIIIIIY